MTSKAILPKAHTNCVPKEEKNECKPAKQRSVNKQDLKTPCKSKHTPVHRRDVPRYQSQYLVTLKKHSSYQNLEVLHKDKSAVAQCKKSKSYENLKTLIPNDISIFGVSKIMGESSKFPGNVPIGVNENRVIKEACTAFLLNAWRHRRQEVADVKKKINALENQTTDLRLQIMSLWQLLESEKSRLAQANLRVMEQHVVAEDAIVNNKTLTTVNTSQQKEIAELRNEISLLRTECNNKKNELIVAKQELFSLHNQMDKERVKVAKLREDKKILLDKAQSAESEVKKKTALLHQNETEQKETQESQMSLLQSLQEKNLVVEELIREKEVLNNELDKKMKTNELLIVQVTDLEKLVKDKQGEIEALKNTSRAYMVEAVRMKLASLETDDLEKGNWPVRATKWLAATFLMTLMTLLQTTAFP